jgi:hypothetical protein
MALSRQHDSTTLSPVHFREQKAKLKDMLALKEHLNETNNTLRQYANAGLQLAKAMGSLSDSFNAFPEFASDLGFQRIPQLLNDLVVVFRRHANMVEQCIILQIQEFIKNQINRVEADAKRAQSDYDSYMKCVDQFMANQMQPDQMKK